jgi:uncharacterized sporulation protein YeaH/YhbH (DUF444 family)
MGGATDYGAGMKFAKEKIFKDPSYPDESWNKYLFTIGDSGHSSSDFGPVMAEMKDLDKILQFHGYMEVGDYSLDSFVAFLKNVSGSKSLKFKYEKATSRQTADIIRAIKALFDVPEEGDKK